MNLNEFLEYPYKYNFAHHIKYLGMKTVYLRKGKRYINNQKTLCLDIASVSAVRPGKGAFTKLLDEIEEKWKDAIFIENIMSTRFAVFFQRRGYVETSSDGVTVCMCKRLHRGNNG